MALGNLGIGGRMILKLILECEDVDCSQPVQNRVQ